MTNLTKNNQHGRSMIEMLGVLAIIGVLSVGGISGYSKAMAKFKLTKAQDQISMLLMNIRTAFATSPSYAGLDTEAARNYNIAPGDMFGAANSLNNAFGGKAYVYSCASNESIACPTGSDTVQYFAISLTDLGREACVSLASSDWGTDGLIGMIVTPSGGTPTTNYAKDLPLTPMGNGSAGTAGAGAGNQCGSKGVYNTITWIYY